MLEIIIPEGELYDETKNFFIPIKSQILHLEHSLVSLSKWESKWCKPFISKLNKTDEESIDYIRCMTITQNVNDFAYGFVTQQDIDRVTNYIDLAMTATTFSKIEKDKINNQVITAEIIYFWMINFNIPFECQKWHLNRLLTLINVCSIKNQPAKKLSKKEQLEYNRAANEKRKMMLNTKG